MKSKLIKADAVLDVLAEVHDTVEGEAEDAIHKVWERVKELPDADVVERKRGQWEWNDDNGYYFCSNCGTVSPRENQDGEYCDCPPFCPNCGADMRG